MCPISMFPSLYPSTLPSTLFEKQWKTYPYVRIKKKEGEGVKISKQKPHLKWSREARRESSHTSHTAGPNRK